MRAALESPFQPGDFFPFRYCNRLDRPLHSMNPLLPNASPTCYSTRVRLLPFPDRHLALAAEGWLELGSSVDAARELRLLSRAAESHPDVLELRWRLYATQGSWDVALDVARVVSQIDPGRPSGWINQSFSLHELNRTEEARELLLPLAKRFPKESIIPYNLACYSCRLGNLTEAREWLLRALRLLRKADFKSMALTDPDLAPLRGYIETL